jgi:pimeloyl-ACP methyl ester carboxylesterase
MGSKTTLLMIPCFTGAPWQLGQLHHLQGWPMRTLRLPVRLDDLEKLADFVLAQTRDTDSYVLVGDPFGAVISIAAAIRRPRGLAGLMLSGGFARNPITSPLLKTLRVPTLILTPEGDRLIGKNAAGILLTGIRRSREVVLPRTGHMLRFSHPGRYSEAVQMFLQSNVPAMEGAQ